MCQKEDDDVCEGSIRLEGPIIARALREMEIPSHTAKLFCVTMLGTCAYPPVTPYQVPFPSGRPSVADPRPRTSGKPPLKVVHYSDIHIDPLYAPGSSANCSKPICCRSVTATAYGLDHAADRPAQALH
jgi:sphingomyelin phosphodiesterase